jgi:hypothetical protein
MKSRASTLAAGLAVSLVVVLCGASRAEAASITVTVDARRGPWDYVNGGLNTLFQYGVGDQLPPVVISGTSGFDFSAGGSFTITYLNGLTNNDGSPPLYNANGDPSQPANDVGGGHGFTPSKYLSSSDYPANIMVLIGTFADSTGAIVGTPFKIGLGRAVVAPAGAARLELGLNDNLYQNTMGFATNTGSLTVSVTGPSAVPEPGSLVLLGSGITAVALVAWRRGKWKTANSVVSRRRSAV